jgi:hypothetical protein
MTYGLLMFTLKFELLFGGMSLELAAGLASSALSAQAFFAMALAAVLTGYRPSLP